MPIRLVLRKTKQMGTFLPYCFVSRAVKQIKVPITIKKKLPGDNKSPVSHCFCSAAGTATTSPPRDTQSADVYWTGRVQEAV